MNRQSKDLALWALGQKNIPDGKENFVFKELNDNGVLKRLFYVGSCQKKTLYNVTVLDMAKDDTIQVLQARQGKTSPEGWKFQKGAAYTIGDNGQVLNTTLFEDSVVKFDKIALPLTTIVFVLLGVPLAITPPRVRYNRGFLFSILIIFAYYVVRALSISFGEAGSLAPFFAAWLPNIVLTIWGTLLYYKKVYTIN